MECRRDKQVRLKPDLQTRLYGLTRKIRSILHPRRFAVHRWPGLGQPRHESPCRDHCVLLPPCKALEERASMAWRMLTRSHAMTRITTQRPPRIDRQWIDYRRGFTLIELLVVIAIIAVLIALLAAGGPVRPRGRPAGSVLEQSEADGTGAAQLSRRALGISAGLPRGEQVRGRRDRHSARMELGGDDPAAARPGAALFFDQRACCRFKRPPTRRRS